MAEADPQADIELDLSCPACGHGWAATARRRRLPLAGARRLGGAALREVHALAWRYGWSERTILALPRRRRRGAYLELVGG